MARPLSDPQRHEVASFVRALYRLGGYATQKEFADDAGYHQVNLSEVMGGKAGIDGLNLIRLIVAAARRAGFAPEQAAVQALTPEPPPDLEARRVRLLKEARDALNAALEEEA